MSVSRLKSLNLDRVIELEEAVELSASARSMMDEYQHLDIPVPEWLEKCSDVLREEIGRRTHAATMSELRRVEAELDSLKTQGERKLEAQNRLKALQNKLGLSTAKAK